MEDLIQLARFLSPQEKILLVDIGGNTGYWAEAFVRFFPQTSIVAFEPDQRAAPRYRERFEGWVDVVLHEVALSDQSGEAELTMTASTTFSTLEEYSVPTVGKSEAVDAVTVKTSRLDDIDINTEGYDRILVKLDVQGHELQVVRGGARLFEKADVAIAELSFAPEFEGRQPSFMPVATLLYEAGHYPIIFQDYGRARGPYAWERDVIFAKESLLERIEGW